MSPSTSLAAGPLPAVGTLMSQSTIPPPPTAAPPSFPPPPPPPPPPDTTKPNGVARRLKNLAASATKDAKSKSDDAKRLKATTTQAQANATFLNARATELSRLAKTFERKPACKNVDSLVSETLSRVKDLLVACERAHNAVLGRKRTRGRTTRQDLRLKVHVLLLEIVLEHPQVSVELRQKCLEAIGKASDVLGALEARIASNPALKQQDLSTTQHLESDTDTDDVEILEDTAEVRALFEKKAERNATTPAEPDPQDRSSSSSAAHDLQAEQQILAELQTSATLLHARKGQEQRVRLKAARIPSQRLPEYVPTERDVALGLEWTLLSSETVRDDLEREIQDGGDQPYVAGHIAVMHRKLAILLCFARKHDALPDAIIDEVNALEGALIRAKPLVKHASVREADVFLLDHDYRNSMKLTLRNADVRLLNMPIIGKRKRVNDGADSDTGSSRQDITTARVKRRRLMEP